MVKVFESVGGALAPNKAMPPASRRVFLGIDSDVGRATRDGFVRMDLKEFMREDLIGSIRAIRASGSLTSGQASKLRGGLGWSSSGTFGRCGRLGLSVLAERQYRDGSVSSLQGKHLRTLDFLEEMLAVVPPKRVRVLGAQGAPVLVYSDAFFQPYSDPEPLTGLGVD